ncbi:MAG: SDR family oxidoreductase [Burkholderiaceae bacterium]
MPSSTNLSGRLAVVTGAQQGIGKAVALALASAGATVLANCLDESLADKLIQELGQLDTTCDSPHMKHIADLSDPKQLQTLFTLASKLGGTDILVNNAAIFPREDFLDVSMAMLSEVLAVNLIAPFVSTQEAAKQMVSHGRGGSIINLTSGAAYRGSPRASHYVTSKAGLVGLTRASAQELAQYAIRVNAIAPGLTDTAQPRIAMSDDELYAAGAMNPIGKIATPGEIANVVKFLASAESSHVTGQVWHVNGGQYLG